MLSRGILTGRWACANLMKFSKSKCIKVLHLSREFVDAHSLEVFKATLDGAFASWSSGRCPCPRGVELDGL